MQEHAVLLRAYARAQVHCSRLLAEQADRIAQLEAQLVRLRGALVRRTTAAALERERAVLCIGADDEAVVLARQLVGATGGRLLQRTPEALEQDDPDAFEASLREADLVICQTGCVSHGGWWRVQDHCRRTGTPCVMVGTTAAQPVQWRGRRTEPAPDR